MGDFFKFPNDQSSIAEADDIVRLQSENDRAVEDAINKVAMRSGSTGGDTIVLTSTSPGSVTVSSPTNSQFSLAIVKVVATGPAGQVIHCTASASGGLASSSTADSEIPSGETSTGVDMVLLAATGSSVLTVVNLPSYTADVTATITVVFVPVKISL